MISTTCDQLSERRLESTDTHNTRFKTWDFGSENMKFPVSRILHKKVEYFMKSDERKQQSFFIDLFSFHLEYEVNQECLLLLACLSYKHKSVPADII